MTCSSCKRPVDELMEAFLVEKGISVRITGCGNCIDIAVEKLKQMEMARNN